MRQGYIAKEKYTTDGKQFDPTIAGANALYVIAAGHSSVTKIRPHPKK